MSVYVAHLKAGAAIKKGQIVKLASGAWVPCAGPEDQAVGVAVQGTSAGALALVCVDGEVDVLVGSALTPFAQFQSDADGEAEDYSGVGEDPAEVPVGHVIEVGVAGSYAKVVVNMATTYTAQTLRAAGFEIVVNEVADDAVAIELQAVDQFGDPIEEEIEFEATIFELSGAIALVAEFTLTAGAENTTSEELKPHIFGVTDPDGSATILVDDVGEDRNAAYPVKIEILNWPGQVIGPQLAWPEFVNP